MYDINRLAAEESRLINIAEYEYQNHFRVTRASIGFLCEFQYEMSMESWVFMGFLSQVQKSLHLAFLSVIRRHEIQTSMMLRYSLESISLTLYSMYNPNSDEYHKFLDDGTVEPKDALNKSYNWLKENYPEFSRKLKLMKDTINKFSSHGNILPTTYNIDFSEDDNATVSFFDKEHKDIEQMRMYWICDIIYGFLQMIQIVNEKHPTVKLVTNFNETLNEMHRRIKENQIEITNSKTSPKSAP